jgi:hypothetical protein
MNGFRPGLGLELGPLASRNLHLALVVLVRHLGLPEQVLLMRGAIFRDRRG